MADKAKATVIAYAPVATATATATATTISEAALGTDDSSNYTRKRKPDKSSGKKKRKRVKNNTFSRLSFADEIDNSEFAPISSTGTENLESPRSLSGLTAARFKQEKSQRRREKKRISAINDGTQLNIFSTAQPAATPTSFEATSSMPMNYSLCLERAQTAASETIGRRRYMEDRYTIINDFSQPAHLKDFNAKQRVGFLQPFCSFVAVYDGHGGAAVAECAQVRSLALSVGLLASHAHVIIR